MSNIAHSCKVVGVGIPAFFMLRRSSRMIGAINTETRPMQAHDQTDIVMSYQLQANCYLNKPVELAAFETIVKDINNFWLTMLRFPQQTATA